MAETIHQIFDKVFKRTMNLSRRAVIKFINGLYGREFPLNSKLTFNETEAVSDNLKRTKADLILTL